MTDFQINIFLFLRVFWYPMQNLASNWQQNACFVIRWHLHYRLVKVSDNFKRFSDPGSPKTENETLTRPNFVKMAQKIVIHRIIR